MFCNRYATRLQLVEIERFAFFQFQDRTIRISHGSGIYSSIGLDGNGRHGQGRGILWDDHFLFLGLFFGLFLFAGDQQQCHGAEEKEFLHFVLYLGRKSTHFFHASWQGTSLQVIARRHDEAI